MIGGRHMRMRADDEARAPIAEVAHCLLFARSLAMDVDDDRVCRLLQWADGKLPLNRRERVVERVHEDAAHCIDDEYARAILGLDQRDTATGRAGGIIDRAQQLRRPFNENQRLLLVPGVITASDHVDTGIDEVLVDGFGDAEAARGVLAIERDEIEFPSLHERAEALEQIARPLRPTISPIKRMRIRHVARQSMTSRSVSTRSRRTSRGVVGTLEISCAAKATPQAMMVLRARNAAIVRS